MRKKFTPKQKAFADEYIKNGGNATQAYIKAGYSENGANRSAQKLLTNTVISEYIASQMERIEKEQHRDIMSLADIQERRSKIAKGEVVDGLGFAPDFSDQLKAMDGLEKALTIAEKQKTEREEKEKREKAPLWTVPITDITSDFVEIYRVVHEAFAGEIDVHEIVSKGGRGSIKSNFWGALAYETIRQDPQAHIVYTRRYKVDLRGSVYNQFMKTVIRYNDVDNWEFKQSPMCAVYKPTGQMVMFVGADKPISLKSFNVPFGYVKLLIHEECDEMAGVEQMDNIEDTFLRSDTPALTEKIHNSQYSTKLSSQQFDKHILGTAKYEEYLNTRLSGGGNPQSIITISKETAQKIIETKAGTGIIKVDRNGNARPQEQITCDNIIGQYYCDGQYIDTNKAVIHYGKRSSHIVPVKGDNYD